jgi:cell division septation protein DedD
MAKERSDGLGFLDRLVILVAWLASCGVVFVIGYYVGKDAVPPSAALAPTGIQVPVAGVPPPTDERGEAGTFYESLGRQTGERSALGGMGVPTTAPRGAAEAEKLRATTSTSRPPTTTTHPAPIVPTTSVPPRYPPTTRPPASVLEPGAHTWVVYVGPTRDRFEAERERSALHAVGYDARVVTMRRDGDVWYRVRAGRFDSEASAERARRDLRDRGIGRAFVQSE